MTRSANIRSGIVLADLDPSVRPADDLFRHINGRWLQSHVIPPDRAVDGPLRALHDEAQEHVRDIIAELGAQVTAGEASAEEAQLGAAYASFMDTARIAALGLAPLAEDLAPVRAAASKDALLVALGALQRTGGVAAVAYFVDNDELDPDRYVVHLTQAGLGLPDEAYYRDPQYADVLAKYRPHIARMLALAGWVAEADAADGAAGRVVALETKLAAHHWDVVKDRDAELTYNAATLASLANDAPGFDWRAWIAAMGAPRGSMDALVVREPGFATGFAALWASEDLAAWRDWLAYHVISARAAFLGDELVAANFDFYGRTLTGAQELRERWRRGVGFVEGAMGEAVGKAYVARCFPPAHKQRMDALVANLIEAYRRSISSLDWMGEETRAKALAKLAKFTPKIGYPARWRDYTGLDMRADDLVGNVRRACAFEQDYELGKIGRPIDRDEWFMTPQTVNAYYNPGMNEIVFPAAILQPPFFDAEADDAVNYGGIGAVIGHEIGHGFDDQGSKYDGDGKLVDWWTAQDRAAFETRTTALIDQYSTFSPEQLDGSHHVNGALTIGENIGDLGGLAIAITAYEIALGASIATAPVIDGLTATQRVFLGWAQSWRAKIRDEELIRRLAIDPHSPDEFRCNGVVRNLAAFHAAFGVQPGDRLYLPPEDRVSIW
ncbi:MAG: peptidase M13 [Micrococcales bacterium]|nr:peptidase M13 [Micrococcales bacterium]